jgi:predicted flap endonuclease-1-like 5' DNA nuclease
MSAAVSTPAAPGATDAGPAPGERGSHGPQVATGGQQAGAVSPEVLERAAREVGAEEKALNDLTIIDGIGRRIARLLAQAGIQTYEQLASADPAHLRRILADAGVSARPDSWPEQARLAAAGDLEALRAWQASH